MQELEAGESNDRRYKTQLIRLLSVNGLKYPTKQLEVWR